MERGMENMIKRMDNLFEKTYMGRELEIFI